MSAAARVLAPSATEGKVIYNSNPYGEGWMLATFGDEPVQSVAIRWKAGRPKPGIVTRDMAHEGQWFVLPEEVVPAVLDAAKQLQAAEDEETLRGYQEMSADVEGEREAFEWIESNVGECL